MFPSPVFFIMQKIAMRTDRHIVDVNFIVTFFNCAFHSITPSLVDCAEPALVALR